MTKSERERKVRFLNAYRWAAMEAARDRLTNAQNNKASYPDDLKNRIEQRINAMCNPRTRMILKLKYIDGLTLDQLAETIRYSVTRTRVFLEKALESFEMTDTDYDLVSRFDF